MQGNNDRRPFLTVALLLVLALLALPLDGAVVQACNSEAFPGEVNAALSKAEPFGHGYGVLYILITIGILTRCDCRLLGSLACCSLGAGIAADGIKLLVGRIRPNALTDNYASTFTGLVPWWESESLHDVFHHSMQSFPSAHTATAVGFAVGLSLVFPRGRWWFFALAGLVAAQRVVQGLHYPSDVLAGASLGILVGHHLSQRLGIGEMPLGDSALAKGTRSQARPASGPAVRVDRARSAA